MKVLFLLYSVLAFSDDIGVGRLTINQGTTDSITLPNTRGSVGQSLVLGAGGVLDWSSIIFPDIVTNVGISSTNAVPRYNGVSGRVIKASGIIIDDSNNVTGMGTLNTRTIANLVDGPATAVSGNLSSFSGTTGKIILDSGIIAADVVTNSGVSADTAIPRFSGTNGTIIQNSGVTLDGSNNISGVGSLSGGTGTFNSTGAGFNLLVRNPDTNDSMSGGTLLKIQNSSINTGGNYNHYISMVADSDGDNGGAISFASMGFEANNSFEIYNPSNAAVSLQTKGTGNVGIGISNPTNKLQVNGTFGVSGVTTFNVGASSSTFPIDRGTSGQALTTNGAGALSWSTVTVPNVVTNAGASIDNAIARFDLATGKIIQNSGVTIDDNNLMSFAAGTTNGIDFDHASRVDANDGRIGARLFAEGLNIIGVQTTAGAGRKTQLWGSLNIVGGGGTDTGGLTTAGNGVINNATIGDAGHGAGYACLSKSDQNSTTQYGFCQGTSETLVNAGTGESISMRINNGPIAVVNSSGMAVTGTLSSSGAATVGSLTSNGNASVAGGLTVTGQTNANGGMSGFAINMPGGTDNGIRINAGNCGGACGQGQSGNGNNYGSIHLANTNPNNGQTGGITFSDDVENTIMGHFGGLLDDRGNNYGRWYWVTRQASGWQAVMVTTSANPPGLYVYGDMSAATVTNRSSRILKKNIEPVKDGLLIEKFNKLNIVNYNLRDRPIVGKKKSEGLSDIEVFKKRKTGLIVEELEKIFPDVVGDEQEDIVHEYDDNGIAIEKKVKVKGYSVADMLAITIKVVQEQQKAINGLVNGSTPALASTSKNNKIEKNTGAVAGISVEEIQQIKNRIEALEGKKVSGSIQTDLSYNQERNYILRPEEGLGLDSENEKLKKEVALLREQNRRIQKQLDAINARLNPKVSSD